ncbi:SprT family zinc-dependent metalloprotease [Amphritea sp. 2_MG-2023]|uniref:M48 family metallopeptidase n=1 Tax=Amphritea TaxID=515417 RepID=UPI001C06AD35|nr:MULTISPECIES: SprT family zinc-dependent metalloprotease [Amphritea]MBU2965468.1 M48 family metallopeptidase [Amphritea atlantica]MDO6418624.1 SprT family zinc-dependent metalloprotease [Amphritea sp. 2_MG-2023]
MSLPTRLPDYTLRRSARRRTIEIQVRPDSVRVLAPTRVSRASIDRMVAEKTEWINTRQQALRQRVPMMSAPVPLDQGSDLLWLGERLSLEVIANQPTTHVSRCGDRLQLALSSRIRKARADAISEQLEGWYRAQAFDYFQARVRFWCVHTRLSPSEVRVRSYRRKWGCCTSRGVVSFNWLLIMAPVHIIDYVIVHELSHLLHMNHSAAFWSTVAKYYPDYREAKAWLNNQRDLHWPPRQLSGE